VSQIKTPAVHAQLSTSSSLPVSPAPSMPYFSSSSGVQINGGSFYDIAGDMNIRGTPFWGRHDSRELVFGLNGPDRQLLGPNRTGGQTAARLSPYGVSSHLPLIVGWVLMTAKISLSGLRVRLSCPVLSQKDSIHIPAQWKFGTLTGSKIRSRAFIDHHLRSTFSNPLSMFLRAKITSRCTLFVQCHRPPTMAVYSSARAGA
jgi:hypothetical protein